MASIAYRLIPKPGGGFHLGREGLAHEAAAESFPSDSLYSALVSTLAETAPDELDRLLPGDDMMPPLRLSSVFPYVGEVLLLPMPPLRDRLLPSDEGARPASGVDRKALKKLAYVSPGILLRLLKGDDMTEWLPGTYNQGAENALLLHEGRVLIARDEYAGLPEAFRMLPERVLYEERVWSNGTVPRVALDRVTTSSSIYQVGRTTFSEDCGLWFMADVTDEALLDELMVHLGDAGIGGERSSGYGAFTAQRAAPPNLPEAAGGAPAMTLSRYIPTRDELARGVLSDGAAYELIDLGGWLGAPGAAPLLRQRIRMVEAGSLLAVGDVTGQLVDVKPDTEYAPDHPVYRSGLALTVGQINGKG